MLCPQPGLWPGLVCRRSSVCPRPGKRTLQMLARAGTDSAPSVVDTGGTLNV